MKSFGDWGVQRSPSKEGPFAGGIVGVSPNFPFSPKTGGLRGLKSVSKRSQIYHYN